MRDERAALRELLRAIQRTSGLQPDAAELRDVQPLIDKLASSFQFAQRDYFSKRFYKSREAFSMVRDRRYMFLRAPRLQKHILPVMAIDARVTKQSAIIKVQVALFERDEKPKALGYRFECGSGSHNMLHCQHITEFTSANVAVPIPGTPKWVPTSQPSFPLDGQSPGVHCVLAAYVSIYGLTDVSSLISQEAPSVEDHMKELHYNPFPLP